MFVHWCWPIKLFFKTLLSCLGILVGSAVCGGSSISVYIIMYHYDLYHKNHFCMFFPLQVSEMSFKDRLKTDGTSHISLCVCVSTSDFCIVNLNRLLICLFCMSVHSKSLESRGRSFETDIQACLTTWARMN